MASHESTPSGCCRAAADTTQPSGASAAALSPEQLSSWGPDIFGVSQHSQGQAVVVVGLELFKLHGLLEHFRIPEACMRAYLAEINSLYLCSNPYHNSIHGADVAQNVNFFLSNKRFSKHLSKLEIFALLLSALVHDCGHPGYTNGFLIKTRHELAIRYNDKSVLENFHIATAFRVALQEKGRNILENLEEEQLVELRSLMIELVLATDFSLHKQLVETCKETLSTTAAEEKEYRRALLILALKCADVSHTAKNMQMHVEWTTRVTLEFFFQGNKEKELGHPFSFGMDRENTNVPGSQVGFIEAFLMPLFEYWAQRFPEFSVCAEQLRSNVAEWKTGRYDGVTEFIRNLARQEERPSNLILHMLSSNYWSSL